MNWEKLDGCMAERAVDVWHPTLLVHPKFGDLLFGYLFVAQVLCWDWAY